MAARKKLGEVLASPYWRAEDAAVVLAAWRNSGKPLARFCRERGVAGARLRRWRDRLECENGAEHGADIEAMVGFVQVDVVEPPSEPANSPWLAEVVRGDWAVRVPLSFDAEELARLLDVVASC